MTKENHNIASTATGRVVKLRTASTSCVSHSEGSFDSFISRHLKDSQNHKTVNASNEWSTFMSMVNS